ncbi:MAG: 6-bladed beta-propeller [Algoriphagus sp.]|uniref:6-bladed beta-propeller n=1 Tax=Algoriphagus sp. TaxID=1872435 RepID=UPI00272FAAD0|nr:6-bladed beta-propeller [Algoriphagus sp.]MDP2040297.1 6-bladed beta-propeller [Algoriphagus sp.]MDP3471386.1 6-bladed beta-propeller [Algoriphagus sp.]
MSKYFCFNNFLLLIILFSCNTPSKNNLEIIIPPESSENRTLSTLVREVQFRPLTGDPKLIPFEADRIDFSEVLIVLGDFTFSQFVYAFEKETGKALEIPLKKGEGPQEVRAVNDFWLDGDMLYVLDGIGRKIVPFSYSSGTFQQLEDIKLDVPFRRFAKTKTGFVGLTGGGQENALAFLDETGKLISAHLPNSIEFLLSPPNPFHKLVDGNEVQVLFNSSFNPEIIRVDNGVVEPFSSMEYEGELVKKPTNTNFVQDQSGFNQYRETLRNQPSFFSIFETTPEQFIFLYFIQDSPRLALSSEGKGSTFLFENLKNDLSFENQPFPKVTGVNGSRFAALVSTDQLNRDDPAFAGSALEKAILANPDALVFVLEFELNVE